MSVFVDISAGYMIYNAPLYYWKMMYVTNYESPGRRIPETGGSCLKKRRRLSSLERACS